MKIDLDELGRKAIAAMEAASKCGKLDIRIDAPGCKIAAEALKIGEHIAAVSPEITLALIARIRELEEALSGVLFIFDDGRKYNGCYYRALLEKGAVLR